MCWGRDGLVLYWHMYDAYCKSAVALGNTSGVGLSPGALDASTSMYQNFCILSAVCTQDQDPLRN